MGQLDRFKQGGISFGTKNFDKLMQSSVSYNLNRKVNKDVLERYMNARSLTPQEAPNSGNRSFIDRSFDALLTPNYVVAGAVKGIIDKDTSVAEGVLGGLRAGNPFGKGYEQGETTFSDVLETAGWKDKAFTGSNFLRGTTGLALDILLDPTTYMTFGISAALKGSGRVGKAAQTIETLAKNNPEFASSIREAGALTDQLAEQIVMRANDITDISQVADNINDIAQVGSTYKISRDQIKQEVDELKHTYNSLVGVDRTGKGITIGVQNMPFGDWVAKKIGITSKPTTLIKDSTIRNISDKTGISSVYAMSRESFYGSKVGELLSRSAGLKRIAEESPEKLFEYVSAVAKLQGKNLDKTARERHIKELGQTLLKLSPAEQKKIIQAIENPKLWQKAKDMVSGSGTNSWAKMRDSYQEANQKALEQARHLQEIRDEYVDLTKEQLQKYHAEVDSLDVSLMSAEQKAIIDEVKVDIEKLIARRSEVASRPVTQPKDYSKAIAELEDEISSNSMRIKKMETEVIEGFESPYLRMTDDELRLQFDDKLRKIQEVDDEITQIGKDMDAARKAGDKDGDYSKWFSNARLTKESSINEFREMLSEYLFGDKAAIPRNADIGKLEAISKAIGNTTDPDRLVKALSGKFGGSNVLNDVSMRDDIINHIFEADDLMDVVRDIVRSESLIGNDMRTIYSYLASKYNYRSISELMSRVDGLALQLNIDKRTGLPRNPLTDPAQLSLYDEYKSIAEKIYLRNDELKRIMSIPFPKDRMKYVQGLKDNQQREEMYDLLFGDIERKALSDEVITGLSDTAERASYVGTKYDRKLDVEDMSFAEEAIAHGKTPQEMRDIRELEILRANKSDKPYTVDELRATGGEAIKENIMKIRTKSMFERSLTAEAKKGLDELNVLNRDYKKALNRYQGAVARDADKAVIGRLKELAKESNQKLLQKREDIYRTTNLQVVRNQAKELDEQAVNFISAQVEATVLLQSKLMPNFKYEHLTSKQKKMLSGMSYSLLKKYQNEFGTPLAKDYEKFKAFIEKEGAVKIQERANEIAEESASIAQSLLVAEKVDYGSGVEVIVNGETVRGVVRKIEEATETIKKEVPKKTRKTAQNGTYEPVAKMKPVIDKKTKQPVLDANGKPKMREQIEYVYKKPEVIEEIEMVTLFEEKRGLGYYKYEVELPGGEIAKVEAKDIVGTYVDMPHYEKSVLPAYTADEIARVIEETEKLKRKLSATKAAQTRQERKISKEQHIKDIKLQRIDEQLNTLLDMKQRSEKRLAELSELDAKQAETLAEIEAKGMEYAKKVEDLTEQLKTVTERYNQVNRALDNDELFETLLKLDMGEEGYLKFVRESTEEQTSKTDLIIDRLEDYDKHLVDIAKKLKHDFHTAGLDEVAIGKLDMGALERMADSYFPRSLSDEGKAFFDANPELIEKYSAVAREYGFGKEFSSFSKSRSEQTRFESIFKVNDALKTELGIRVFEENLGQAYINRMLTSTDLVYDARAMKDLMYRFGYEVGADNAIKPGYQAVINYGMLKERIRKVAIDKVVADLNGEKVSNEVFSELLQKTGEDMVKRAGLDPAILKGETTPLIRVEANQIQPIKDIIGGGIIRQVNSATVERANQARQLVMERDEKAMLKLYDKFMTFFKLNQTTVSPAFHVRNHIGAMFVGWLGVGKEAANLSKHKEAYDALKLFGKPTELRNLRPISPDEFGGKTYYWDEIMDLANSHRVIDEGFMMKDFAADSYSQGTRLIPGKYDPFNTKDFLPYKIGSKVATYSDNINRLVQFQALLKQGKTPLQAAETVRKYMFDYSDLTTFEKRWMKRIFPYYTFMRKNIPLMANEMIDNAEKMALVAKLTSGVEGMSSETVPEGLRQGFAQDWVQMPFNLTSNSGEEPVLMNPAMPYMQLRDINMEGDLGAQAKTLFSQSAPMLKVPIELATNWNSYFDDELVSEEGNQLTPRLAHVASQLYAFNAVKNFTDANTMDDKLLALLNSTTGVKMSTYDVEGLKKKLAEEAYDDHYKLTIKNLIGSGVKMASGFKDNVKSDISDMAVSLVGKPYDAFEANGAMAPISETRYEGLTDNEKAQYTFDEKTKSFINNRAKQFEKEQYEKSGVMKRFMWMLVDDKFDDKTVVQVDRVVDGDTFVARKGNDTFNVRLLLVDTPESKGDYKDNPQEFSLDAAQYTREMILGKDVKLYLDDKTTYGRRLAFVTLDGKSVQEELVKEGLGKVRQYDNKFTEEAEGLYNLEESAYRKRKGVWSIEGNAVPRSNTGYQK